MRNPGFAPLGRVGASVLVALGATTLSFILLGAGRRVVEVTGSRAMREALVRGSDQLAAQSLAELGRRTGCEATARAPFPYSLCVALSPLPVDSVRIVVRVEPRNRLIARDSVVFRRVGALP